MHKILFAILSNNNLMLGLHMQTNYPQFFFAILKTLSWPGKINCSSLCFIDGVVGSTMIRWNWSRVYLMTKMWFILLINIHRWKFTLVSTSIPSAHHSASNTAKSATKYLPKGGISQYASNLLLLSKTNIAPLQGNSSIYPLLICCHHPMERLAYRGHSW